MNPSKPSILLINGSASTNSSNGNLLKWMESYLCKSLNVVWMDSLKSLPHFDPELSLEHTPQEIISIRKQIEEASAVLIVTPEYVFSIPSGLKNAIEWCVSTTIFTDKPTALITASAHGVKGHEELQLLMRTLSAKFTDETCLLISGIKGKVNEEGKPHSEALQQEIIAVMEKLIQLVQLQKLNV